MKNYIWALLKSYYLGVLFHNIKIKLEFLNHVFYKSFYATKELKDEMWNQVKIFEDLAT